MQAFLPSSPWRFKQPVQSSQSGLLVSYSPQLAPDDDPNPTRDRGGLPTQGGILNLERGVEPWCIKKGTWALGKERRLASKAQGADNQPPSTLKVDVHGILFAIVLIVFVIHPLAQWALGL